MASTKKSSKKKTSTKKKTSKNQNNINKKKNTSTKKIVNPKKSTTPKKVTSSKKANNNTNKQEIKLKAIEKIEKKVEKIEEPIVLPKLKETKKDVNVKQSTTKNVKKNVKKSKSNAKNIARTKNSELLSRLKKLQRKIKIYGLESVISKRNIAVIIVGIMVIFSIVLGIKVFTKNDTVIDLSMISNDIDQLKTVAFDINAIPEIVTESGAYKDLKDYYEYDFEKLFNLKIDWLEEQAIKYNKTNNQFLIAIKPTNGNESNTRSAIEQFAETNKIKDYQYLDYNGYQFFINSSNNTAVISKIKQTQIRVFDILKELKKDDIKSTLNINSNLYKESNVKLSMIVSDTTGYIILKPSNSSAKKEIQEKMKEYFATLQKKWKDKNDKDNLKLIENRYEGEYDGYLVYIISKDNSLVLQLIQK